MIADILLLGLAAAFCSILAVIAARVRALDRVGALSAFSIGFLLLVLPDGGWMWFMVLLTFLVASHALTLFMYEEKLSRGVAQEKRGTRSWPNVLANGLVPLVCAVGTVFVQSDPALVRIFLGSVSVAAADTFGTELGLLSPGEPRLLARPRVTVPPGTPGGVSLLGLTASLVGAAMIPAIGYVVGLGRTLPIFLVIVLGGLLGSLFDSLLGSTAQGIYECAVCGKSTEHRKHCGKAARKLRGFFFLENNSVNLLANIFGGLFALFAA